MKYQKHTVQNQFKLFIEPTTRCNLSCAMCVKQSPHADIPEGDLSMDLFVRLIPALPHAEAVILNGIGEPLLHPGLERMIVICKQHMPQFGRVGFQTNAMLIDDKRAESLTESGLDQICISVDGVTAPGYEQVRNGGRFDQVRNAFVHLQEAKKNRKTDSPEIGIEFVLMKNNIHELEGLIAWADSMGATFILVSHLLPYRKNDQAMVVHRTSSDESHQFFEKWANAAIAKGIKLPDNDLDYYRLCWPLLLTSTDKEAGQFLRAVEHKAYRNSMPLHLLNLLKEKPDEEREILDVFSRAKRMACEKGIKLTLPAFRPQKKRHCRFVEENSLFVSWKGSVHPCYFLWHKYACWRSESIKHVNPVSFGDLADRDVLDISNDPAFVLFRNTVKSYDYPYCTDCSIGPCPLITSDSFERDCYLTEVPCGDCGWNSGLYHCLG